MPVVPPHIITRDELVAVYHDWVNNYLTIAKFAADRRLTLAQAMNLLDLAKGVAENPAPND